MKFTRVEQFKILLMAIIGVIFERSQSYKPLTLSSAVGNIFAVLVLSLGLGIIIHYVMRLFGKRNGSPLHNGIKYGFVISLFILVASLYEIFLRVY